LSSRPVTTFGSPLQHWQQVRHRHLQPVDLAGHQRVGGGGGIGDHLPLHPIHQHTMPARGEARRLVARHVALEWHHRGVAADDVFVLEEPERAGTDNLGHLLVGIGAVGDALRHHDRGSLELRQQLGQRGEPLAQPQHDGAIVRCLQRVEPRLERGAAGIALHPAPQ
jgi:hypothetical protein